MTSSQNNDSTIHHRLSQWIIENGGHIHKSLALCTPDTVHEDPSPASNKAHHYSQRGIFSKHAAIKKGEELIRLPEKLALDGKDLPMSYGDRNASPWLRCLACLLQSWHIRDGMLEAASGQKDATIDDKGCYLASLPEEYDSLIDWTSWELRSFLAGTSLGTFAMAGVENNDSDTAQCDEDGELERNMHKRYETTVLPYLKYLKMQHGFFEDIGGACSVGDTTKNESISDPTPDAKRQKVDNNKDGNSMDHLYNYFRQGCKCISTRAFHMQSSSDSAGYQGPYLLPYIDLLNHASHGSPKHVTTLQRDPNDGSFVMVAERDIEQGEEICHSYDSGAVKSEITDATTAMSGSLNSAQLLQTFGFVDTKSIGNLSILLQTENSFSSDEHKSFNLTPAILSKDDICRICEDVSRSAYPESLRVSMNESGLVDEGWEHWDLPSEKGKSDKVAGQKDSSNDSRQRAIDSFPSEVVVTFESPLSDEIITICSLNFLPEEAIDELCESSKDKNEQNSVLLSKEVLEDYFLGMLVLQSILKIVDERMRHYKVHLNKDDFECNTTVSTFLKLMWCAYKTTGDDPLLWGDQEVKDLNVLSTLNDTIDGQNDAMTRGLITKFKCGMTVSLEERACLLQLKKAVLNMMMQLNES